MNDQEIIKMAEQERDKFLSSRVNQNDQPSGSDIPSQNSFPHEQSLEISPAEANSTPQIYSWEEFLNQESSDQEWIIEDILRPGWLAAIGGHGKQGKTTLMIHLLNTLKKGQTFIKPCQKVPVIYVNCEMGKDDIRELIREVVGSSEDSEGEIAQIISQLPLPLNLKWLESHLKEQSKPGVCVIDSFRGSFLLSGDAENQAGTVGNILRSLQNIARRTNWTVILIHHFRKSGNGDALDMAGSGEWLSAPDVIMTWTCKSPKEAGTLNLIGRIPPCEPYAIRLSRKTVEFLGSVSENEAESERVAVLNNLTDEWVTSGSIIEATGINESTVRTRLNELLKTGKADRSGEGKRNSPYLWRKLDSLLDEAEEIFDVKAEEMEYEA